MYREKNGRKNFIFYSAILYFQVRTEITSLQELLNLKSQEG